KELNKDKTMIKLLRKKIDQLQTKQPNKKAFCERCKQNNYIFAGKFCVDCWDDLEHQQIGCVKCVKNAKINTIKPPSDEDIEEILDELEDEEDEEEEIEDDIYYMRRTIWK